MSKLILIVEDDVDLLELYKEILELHEFNVETALNGEEGVKKYIEKRPSLVIMDGDMPILDGYEAFKQIKKIDNNANAKNPVSFIFNLIHDVRYLYFQ